MKLFARSFLRSFPHFDVIYSVESKSSGEVPWQWPQGPGIPTAHGIRLFLYSRAPLAWNGYLLYPPFTLTLSISVCLYLFLRPVCIRASLFFRFTRTRWCPSLAYPPACFLFYPSEQLRTSLFLSLLPSLFLYFYAFMPIWLVLLGRFHRDLSPCTCCWLVSMTGGGLSF